MGFKIKNQKKSNYNSPIELFNDIKERKVAGPLLIQGNVINEYTSKFLNSPNVALEMPTGTGKTLVALLIAEWRRIQYGNKILYLCPTKQLAYQTKFEAENRYGIKVNVMVGAKSEFSQKETMEYETNSKITVTTYYSFFNINPYFSDPDIIIIDDAHSAESTLSQLFSINLTPRDESNKGAFSAFLEELKPILSNYDFPYFNGEITKNANSSTLLPFHQYATLIPKLIECLDENLINPDSNKFAWTLLRSKLHSCNIFLDSEEILIRPYILPIPTFDSFRNAKQRIFLSATLGDDGYLNRLYCLDKIEKVSGKVGSEKQGVGRRFFYFPSKAFEPAEIGKLIFDIFKCFDRAIYLVASDSKANKLKEEFRSLKSVTVFGVRDIESSKDTFISTKNAIAIIANRYDGMNFPGDECKLMFIDDFPKTLSLQDSFLINQLGGSFLLKNKLNTNITQALGRCNRSTLDNSMIVVLGQKLPLYLLSESNSKSFHPELQAELSFGLDQSDLTDIKSLTELISFFNNQTTEWLDAEKAIIAIRNEKNQEIAPYQSELAELSKLESKFQLSFWDNDLLKSLDYVKEILSKANHSELQPFRIFWNYIASNIYFQLFLKSQNTTFMENSKLHLQQSISSPLGRAWLGELVTNLSIKSLHTEDSKIDQISLLQAQNLETLFIETGIISNRNYNKRKLSILDGLNSRKATEFEIANMHLGEFLGFAIDKPLDSGSSDCIWYLPNKIAFVFEDNNEALDQNKITTHKIDQANRHIERTRERLKLKKEIPLYSIIVSNCEKIDLNDLPNTKNIYLWKVKDIIAWANRCFNEIESIRNTFSSEGNMFWYNDTARQIQKSNFSCDSIRKEISKVSFQDLEIIKNDA